MAFNERIAERVRKRLKGKRRLEEKRMFGGLTFMLNGRMCCAIAGDNLMVRVDPDHYDDLLKKPHAHVMDITGRPMKGFIFVDPEGYKSSTSLNFWIDEVIAYAKSQSSKKNKKT
ncbi:TfoX/Sxy family protein [bacterium]|nr:TfoX/Sxy family protein [bacterium]